MNGYILILLFIIVVISYVTRPRVIFTCTTFFDFKKMDRWASFQRAVNAIQADYQPDKWFIVNEYSESPRADWAKRMAENYPQMTFIQKTREQKGQAKSLNLILDAVNPYDYWIQWEDSWFPERPFLGRAMDVMTSTSISQLQVTHSTNYVSWLDVSDNRKQARTTWYGTDYIEIKPSDKKDDWPLFSLQPSLNRVSDIRSLGKFNTDPAMWPVKFELQYAHRWLEAGCRKAVLPDGPVIRPGHVSTYS